MNQRSTKKRSGLKDSFDGSETIGALMGQGGGKHSPGEGERGVKDLMDQGAQPKSGENADHSLQRLGVLMGQA